MALLRDIDRLYTAPEDICAHLGEDYDTFYGAAMPPIYQTTLFSATSQGMPYSYGRNANPTTEIAERKIAALEGGDGAVIFGSGMAAMSTAILHFCRPGGHIVMLRTAYPGATAIASSYLPQHFGIECTLVNGDSTEEILDAVKENTCLIYMESPSSGIFKMQDLDAITAFARSRGIGTVIDNTYATPLHQKPLAHGVDIVCHTASKYLGGHSSVICGVIVSRKDIIQSIESCDRVLLGGILDPHASWLLISGLRTFPTRMKAHQANAMRVAKFLEAQPQVTRVYYPGLDSYPDKELFDKYMTGTNGLMSFTLDTDAEGANRFIKACHIFRNGCSWGGFESLIIGLTIGAESEELKQRGLPANLIRIHVGLEDVDSQISDLKAAFRAL